MSRPVIEVGEKIHVITRRLFKDDLRRHFAGTVTGYAGLVIRAEGYVFVMNPQMEEYRRRPEQRTRLFGLGDSGFIYNILPPDLQLDRLRYEMLDGRLIITDGARFQLDVNEFRPSW